MPDELLVVVTADDVEIKAGEIFEFLASVRGQPVAAVVVQRGQDERLRERLRQVPEVLAVISVPACGVSQARNAGLAWLADHVVGDPVVAFPDDDCTYPPGLGRAVLDMLIPAGPRLLVGAYGPTPESVDRLRFPDRPTALVALPLARTVASVGLFAHLRDICRVGGFNEDLGVGSLWDSGEEYDLAVRLVAAGIEGRYDPTVVVLHPYRQAPVGQRAVGWLALNTAYARVDRAFLPLAVRAWAGLVKKALLRQVPTRQAWVTAREALSPSVASGVIASLGEARRLRSRTR